MKKPEHIISVYFDFPNFNRKKAKTLIDSLLDGDLKIEKYGVSESKYFNIDSVDINVLYTILSDYTRYFSGMLFLKDTKGKYLMTIDYNCFSFTEITVYISGNKIAKSDVYSHFQNICSIKGSIFGFTTDYESYTIKHKLVIPSPYGSGYSEQYEGHKFDNGIPGIYTNTFFSNRLVLDLGIDKLNTINYQKEESGYYFSDLDESSQKNVIQEIGANYFFDLKDYTTLKDYPSSLVERVEQFKTVNRRVIPQYTGFQLNLNEQEVLSCVNQVCDQQEQNELLNGSCELFQKIVKPKLICNKTINETQVYAYGYLLGELWAKRYIKKWNPTAGIPFGNSILNPYHCIIQMIEDDMDLIDREKVLDMYK